MSPSAAGPPRSYAVLRGPRSGRGRAAVRAERVLSGLRSSAHAVHELRARDAATAAELSRAAARQGVDVLVAVGGDGLVQIAAGACTGSGTALGIVPAGSGNDTARSLGIPLATGPAVQTLLAGTPRTIDLIEVTPPGRVVVGSVPAALDARIADRSARVPARLGAARYAVATLVELPQLRAHPYRLTLDGALWETEAMVVTVCNLPIFGGGMQIAPDADPGDGLLDLVVITPVRAKQALGLLRDVFRGRHTTHPSVQVRRVTTVRVEGPRLTAYGDGEPLADLPVTATVRPGALDVVVPAR